MLRACIFALLLSASGGINAAAQEASPNEAVTPVSENVVADAIETKVETKVEAAEKVTAPAAEPAPEISSTPAFTLQDALASGEHAVSATPVQEKCISIMSGFPDNGHETRYQFFKLTRTLAEDVNPIGNMGYLIDFALDCEGYLSGQIDSLEAFDNNLTQSDFDVVIGEDALFMRQILSDSLFRLGAQDHDVFGPAVTIYAGDLVRARNSIEYAGFEAQLESLEAVFMTDLDGRLARSNDVINNEIDREALAQALEITSDLNEQAKLEARRKTMEILTRILGGR